MIESIQTNRALVGTPNSMPVMGALSDGKNRYSKSMTEEERAKWTRLENIKNGMTYQEDEDLW